MYNSKLWQIITNKKLKLRVNGSKDINATPICTRMKCSVSLCVFVFVSFCFLTWSAVAVTLDGCTICNETFHLSLACFISSCFAIFFRSFYFGFSSACFHSISVCEFYYHEMLVFRSRIQRLWTINRQRLCPNEFVCNDNDNDNDSVQLSFTTFSASSFSFPFSCQLFALSGHCLCALPNENCCWNSGSSSGKINKWTLIHGHRIICSHQHVHRRM